MIRYPIGSAAAVEMSAIVPPTQLCTWLCISLLNSGNSPGAPFPASKHIVKPTFDKPFPYWVLDIKVVTSSGGADRNENTPLCQQCKNMPAEIFQEDGDYCLECWQERVCPLQ